MKNGTFETEYKKLNPAQKEAVDTLSGPVMVVAGPGTGKTQVLALRIANILKKTDIKADSVLCLTFTNSAVEAMKHRLSQYIGEAAEQVNVSTFHSFGLEVIKENYKVLDLETAPRLLEEVDRAEFFDEILNGHDWKYLRPRGNGTRYYADLKSLISLLSRERITPEFFLSEIMEEIQDLENNPENISSRGESKGQLKKEILTKLESLERTREVVTFINLYKKRKAEKNLQDYDDVLENLVRIIETSEEVASGLREKYLYVLVDEHQDSSRVQNEFLAHLWGGVEQPDIFVVGDDRQLIYGFSGASIDHFKGFKKTFPEARLVPLVDNYRSTQVILDASHALLESVMSDKKLVSHSTARHPIRLIEAERPDDEIRACVEDIKEKIKEGVDVNDCAILMPKNVQARNAIKILHEMGLPASSPDALNFFDQEEAQILLRVLKIISVPENGADLALSFFNRGSGMTPIEAHRYIAGQKMRDFSLTKIIKETPASLFVEDNRAEKWIQKLSKWCVDSQKNGISELIKIVGEELFGGNISSEKLASPEEILGTILSIAKKAEEKNPHITLPDFVAYLDRLELYGEHVAVEMEDKNGIKVLTLHSSKGLEFDYVWIAHMDEWSLRGARRGGFFLPESIAEKIEERDVEAVKRKLFVAITRAKRFCTLSYAKSSGRGADQELAGVIADLPSEVFKKQTIEFADEDTKAKSNPYLPELVKMVAEKYKEKYVSASMLNNFFECPWKWYFMNLLGLPGDPAETLEFGIAVHASLEKILRLPHLPADPEVEKILKEEVSKSHIKDERIRIRIYKEAQAIILRWVARRLPEIKLGRKTEESISIADQRFPYLKIYGKIDLIENLAPGEVRVTDFKTGSVRKKSDIEKRDEEGRMSGNLRQLAMYSYLLQHNSKWKADVRESRLEFLEARNLKEIFYDRVINEEEINLLVQDITDYDKEVKDGGWFRRSCHYNSYGKNIECEYCKLAEIYK